MSVSNPISASGETNPVETEMERLAGQYAAGVVKSSRKPQNDVPGASTRSNCGEPYDNPRSAKAAAHQASSSA
jgi:hypothetical protein